MRENPLAKATASAADAAKREAAGQPPAPQANTDDIAPRAANPLARNFGNVPPIRSGELVVDLDPGLIDESFIQDRFNIDERLDELLQAIQEAGQMSPILVRRNPKNPERYQIAFGRRRLRVAVILERKVKAIIREMTDQELIIAQGQENTGREAPSFIERVVFMNGLVEKGFSRAIIGTSVGINKGLVSKMLSIGEKLPDDLARLIGSCPKVGREPWLKLAGVLEDARKKEQALKLLETEEMKALTSDERFASLSYRLSDAKPKGSSRARQIEFGGKKVAKVMHAPGKVTISFNEGKQPDFSKFLESLGSLYQTYMQTRSAGGSAGGSGEASET